MMLLMFSGCKAICKLSTGSFGGVSEDQYISKSSVITQTNRAKPGKSVICRRINRCERLNTIYYSAFIYIVDLSA